MLSIAGRLTRFIHFPHRHLISLAVTQFHTFSPVLSSSQRLSRYTVMDSVTKSLTSLSLNPTSVHHSSTNSLTAWRDALTANPEVPTSFELIKTLVYKPKTSKTATPVPVVVIAHESASVNSGAIGKKLNLKDLRLASEDLLKEFFSLDKDSRMLNLLCFHEMLILNLHQFLL